ncbi:MAG: hypothetical protein VZR11_05360 [Succinimonas sp.]|nr:hypothetical protein [Succinimonas sp.]
MGKSVTAPDILAGSAIAGRDLLSGRELRTILRISGNIFRFALLLFCDLPLTPLIIFLTLGLFLANLLRKRFLYLAGGLYGLWEISGG